ncbi:MAG: PilN domain-containing protein [Firmicutes bacterium]|nr:PilN domain-containing protein [Bacillota bacterium]
MDIRINLLPPEIILQQNRQQRRRRLLSGGSVIAALLLIAYAALFAATQLAGYDAARLAAERLAVEEEVRAYGHVTGVQGRIAGYESLLPKVTGQTGDFSRILNEIGLRLPLNVWLTEITINGKNASGASAGGTAASPADPAGKTAVLPGGAQTQAQTQAKKTAVPGQGEVSIKGWTFDHYSVALWLEELETVKGLKDLQCQLANSEKNGQSSMIRFEIKATLDESAK